MTEDIIKSLADIGYSGTSLENVLLETALNEGPKNILYTEIVNFLTNELRVLCKIDEQVNKINAPEDSVSFLMELSSFLKELGCPHTNLTQGHISDRLADIKSTTLLLDYLITELMAARILQEIRPDTNRIELKVNETPQAANMKKILTVLRFPKPPANISMQTLFSKLIPTVDNAIKKAGNDLIGVSIFNLSLTDKQWHILNQVYNDLHAEYTIRREMLLKRLDCTIQSFQWSDKMKGKDEIINQMYSEKRKQLRVEPNVSMSDLISAREDLAIIEKTSNASVRKNTKSAINRVIIGNVPDRGGRTNELAPPPPEMPSWQQRSSGPPQGGGRGGGFGQGRGRGDYSGGGGMQSSGSFNDYNRGGSGYGRGGGNDYNRGGSGYNRGGGNDSNRGGSGYNRGAGNDSNRGGSGYNRGGSDYNRGGGGSDYNRGGGGSDYNKGGGGNDYNRGGRSDYNRGGGGGADYNRGGGSDYNKGGESNYSRSSGGRDSGYSRGGGSGYNRGGGSSNYSSDYNRSNSGSFNKGSNSDLSTSSYSGGSDYSKGGQNYNRNSGNYSGFDSAGSYGGYQEYTSNEPKRAKTYDYFQNQKTTYADQYVQESQHNQQYQSRRGEGSGYNRGGSRGARY